jgi:hypothetical protein
MTNVTMFQGTALGTCLQSRNNDITVYLKNCLLEDPDNASSYSVRLTYGYTPDDRPTIVDGGCNIVETQAAGAKYTFVNGVNGNIVGVQPNLNLDSALADNGTLKGTQTLALSTGSVAINAGSATAHGPAGSEVTPPAKDQRGLYRAGTVDIGAYEYGGLATSTPFVSTTSASAITATGASSGGTVTDDGGATVTARGVCWSTSADPTIADPKTSDGSGSGSFASTLAGLSPGTTYHYRAYATNAVGTSYGADLTFTTAEAPLVETRVTLNGSAICAYGSAPLSGVLATKAGQPLDGGTVVIEWSADGSQWQSLGSTVCAADGTYSLLAKPTTPTLYRARFSGDGGHGEAVSQQCSVKPRVQLSKPKAPRTVGLRRKFTVTSALLPAHAASDAKLKVVCFHREKGKWVARKTVNAKCIVGDKTTRLTARISLPKRGAWRIRVLHPDDAGNALTWSKGANLKVL